MPRTAERIKKYQRKVRQYVVDLREVGCCMDCGEEDSRVLQFHHRDPAAREADIISISSFPRLLRELEKCDLVCANCHIKRHKPDYA